MLRIQTCLFKSECSSPNQPLPPLSSFLLFLFQVSLPIACDCLSLSTNHYRDIQKDKGDIISLPQGLELLEPITGGHMGQ